MWILFWLWSLAGILNFLSVFSLIYLTYNDFFLVCCCEILECECRITGKGWRIQHQLVRLWDEWAQSGIEETHRKFNNFWLVDFITDPKQVCCLYVLRSQTRVLFVCLYIVTFEAKKSDLDLLLWIEFDEIIVCEVRSRGDTRDQCLIDLILFSRPIFL